MSDLGKAGAAGPMTEGSARSYFSYVNQIEAILGISLDGELLDEAGVASVINRLHARQSSAALSDKMIGNLSSGVRAYARYKSRNLAT